MKSHTNPPTAIPWEPTEDEIREHAYQLWLKNGQPEGRDLEHWFSAREALKLNATAHTQSGSRPPHRRTHVSLKGATSEGPRIVLDATTKTSTPVPVPDVVPSEEPVRH